MRSRAKNVQIKFAATVLALALDVINFGLTPLASAETANKQTQTSDDIIVTATRRSERVGRIPVSIVAKDQWILDSDRIETFSDLTRSTPGLAARGAFGGTAKIAIRGIASNVGTATTGVYIDETPLHVRALGAAGIFADSYPELFDLARVEVLRGPQGTLFGEASEGGTIRFITADPDLSRLTVYGKASLATTTGGEPSSLVGQAISIPLINDVAAVRVSALARRDGGWIDRLPYTGLGVLLRDVNHRSVANMRATLRIRPMAGFIIQSSLFYQHQHRADTDQYWESLSRPDQGLYQTGQPLAQPTDDRMLVMALRAERDIGWASLTVSSSWLSRDNKISVDYTTHLIEGLSKGAFTELPGTPQYAVTSNFIARQDNFVQEARLASPKSDEPVSWTLGLRYSSERQSIEQKITDPLLSTLTTTLFGCAPMGCFGEDLLSGNISYFGGDQSKDRHIAAFASVDWKLARGVTLTTGMRLEHTSSTIENSQDGPFNYGATGGMTRVNGNDASPKIALTYDVNGSSMLYASLTRGARPGGGNTGIPLAFCANDLAALGSGPPAGYKGDSVWTSEIGTKLRRGAFRIEGSGYLTHWAGIQQSIALPNCGFAFTTNLGSAVSRGFDMQIYGRLITGLELSALIAFTDAHYIHDEQLRSGSLLVLAGDRLPMPAWQTRVSGRYERPLGSSLIALQMDYDHSSSYARLSAAPSFNADPLVSQAAATDLFGARASLSFGPWRLTAFVDNLLNSDDRLFRARDTPFEQTIRDQSFRPRTIGMELMFNLQ